MSILRKAKTIFHTVKYLRPIQVVHQIKNRIPHQDSFRDYLKNNVKVRDITLFIPEVDANEQYLARFDIQGMLEGNVTLLNHNFVFKDGWYDEKASHLENFNLHYFEYAIALAVAYEKTGDKKYQECVIRLYESWQLVSDGPNAKHPYTISLRLTNLLIVGSLLGDEKLIKSLYPQYRYLIKHQEKRLLGNHYFENLKAIVLCSLVFDEPIIYRQYITELLRELEVQVLPDGVHYELSLMYHKIVLEGIIRVTYATQQVEKQESAELLPIIQRMVSAITSLEKGMGKTPSFNDSADNVAKECNQLCTAARNLFKIEPKKQVVFNDSGYYKLYDANIAVLFDAGRIGPNYMPGHAHCDCLSYELSIGGVPLFVNSGTFQYQGSKRSYFRSTRAHNTVMIGNHEQSECWGEHRVARRTTEIEGDLEGQTASGSYKNYLGEKHSRLITLKDNKLTVIDSTIGSGIIHSFLHLADGFKIIESDSALNIVNDGGQRVCQIRPYACSFTAHTTGELIQYAPEFGLLYNTCCLEFFWEADNKEHGYTIYF